MPIGPSIDHWRYFAVLALCLVATIPLEFFYKFKVWRSPKRLFRSLLPGVIIFTIWDVLVIKRGHWHFSDRFTVGWDLPGGLPVEEILFFVVVPAAAISGFEAVRTDLAKRASRRATIGGDGA